nr:vegetative incompatibility protein het-e-1 [Quercus suber]
MTCTSLQTARLIIDYKPAAQHARKLPRALESYHQVQHHPYKADWHKVMDAEFKQALAMETLEWTSIDKIERLLNGPLTQLPLRWVYDYKFDSKGLLARFKAHYRRCEVNIAGAAPEGVAEQPGCFWVGCYDRVFELSGTGHPSLHHASMERDIRSTISWLSDPHVRDEVSHHHFIRALAEGIGCLAPEGQRHHSPSPCVQARGATPRGRHIPYSVQGKPIRLPNGESFFVRDILEKMSRRVKKFVAVGDTVVQYDPGHAALPWALVSMNNLDKHAAVLEGIKKVSHYLVWSKIEESNLIIPYDSHDQLGRDFIQLYAAMLKFMARCIRFLRNISHLQKFHRELHPSDLKYDHSEAVCRKILTVKNQLVELEKPVLRVERAREYASSIADRHESQAILDWASVIPFQKHFHVVEDKALSGTGQWLFSDVHYFDWHQSSRSQILWLHGSSGSGKSTLMNVAEPERADPEPILRCLMRQASDLPGGPLLHPKLEERFRKRRIAGDVSAREATDIIVDTIKDRPVTYIVVDALDECDRQKRDILIDALKIILAQSASLVKIFVTSRENHQDITWAMNGYPALCIDASRNQADINRFVAESVQKAIENRKLLPTEKVSPDLKQRIEQSLCSGAARMFRWVELQVQYLCSLRRRSTLLDRLGKLPPGLEQIYEDLYRRNMKELDEKDAKAVKRILSWLLVAKRPLTTSEMCELVRAPGEPDMTNDTVLDMCFDLVRLDHETGSIQVLALISPRISGKADD